jgi:hypothetical protein
MTYDDLLLLSKKILIGIVIAAIPGVLLIAGLTAVKAALSR